MAGRAKGFSAAGTVVDLKGEVRELHAQRQVDYESTRRPIMDYADLIPEPGFGALDFARFPHLVEPFYSDEVAAAAEVVYQKSTQIGATTGLWRWGVREADQYGRTVIYTFPTQDHVTEFGDERIEPAIEGSDYLKKRIPAHFVRTKRLKRIGRGWVYFRGAKSRSGAQSTSAQSIVFDEYDELDQGIVGQFERRLSGARATGKAPRMRRSGIPRFPGGPLERAYTASDRREWLVTCPSCGVEQPLVWAKNVRWTMPGDKYVAEQGEVEHLGKQIDGERRLVFRAGHDAAELSTEDAKIVGDVWRCCAMCETSLEEGPILGGRWVAQNPGHPVIGFYIHRLIVQDADLAEMVRNSRKTSPTDVEAFHSNDLGVAFAPAEAALTQADIDRACGMGAEAHVPVYRGTLDTIAGIDVASERNINMGIYEMLPDGRRRAVWIGECANFTEVEAKLVAYNVLVAAIDSMPERRLARAVAANLPGRVHLVQFVEPPFGDRQPEALAFDPKKNMVSLHRTEALDAMMDGIRHVRTLPLKFPPAGYVQQLMAPVRRTEYNSQGVGRRVYVTPPGLADDYALMEVYVLAAAEMYRLRMQVTAQQNAAMTPLSDQQMGIRRPGLDRNGGDELRDDYNPGFRGG